MTRRWLAFWLVIGVVFWAAFGAVVAYVLEHGALGL